MSEKIKVMIADDHAIVREGALRLLNAQTDMEVVGEAQNGHEVMEKARDLRPDVLVLDISLPGLTGLDLVPLLRSALPRTQIAVLSVHNNPAFVQQILGSGALAYVLKTSPTTELLEAIRSVYQGEYYLSAKVRAYVIGSYLRQPTASGEESCYSRLTEREKQVFRLVAQGKTNRDIGEILFLSPRTIEKYRAGAMQKLNLRDLTEVIHYAIKHGIVASEDYDL